MDNNFAQKFLAQSLAIKFNIYNKGESNGFI